MKELIKSSIQNFSSPDLSSTALQLFKVLGYNTANTITQDNKSFKSFKENFVDLSENKARFNEDKALSRDWASIDFLFQLSDNLVGIKGGKVNNQIINSVVFACIELSGNKYSRTQLAEITRQVNIVFAMPVVLIFKYDNSITLSIIHRRVNKIDEQKDVLEKVSLIKDISLTNPHRAQIEILNDFAFENLANKKNPSTFVELINAWEVVFNTKSLNKQFFKKIANWYFLSVAYSTFPYEYLRNDIKLKDKTTEELQTIANQKATIRFITRMIFVWFLKEKGLVSNDLFDKEKVSKILKKDKSKNPSNYYNAILQNLFFATLNKAKKHRAFALDKSFKENKSNYDVNSLYRYETMFEDESPESIMKLFKDIPFLNGGLFDSLDSKEQKEIIDGFSRNPKWQAKMPDFLFFEEDDLDFDEELNKTYETKNKSYDVKGLFTIFNEYKFTIEENTPTETDVALDPYLLGEIFENLLAYYNPETGTTARKGSGSFYTPQEIVNYMVDESLNAYLETKLGNDTIKVQDIENVDVNEKLTLQQKTTIIKALSDVKILDPACGSGAFPMGVLYKMVAILKHIDTDNSIWKQIQHDKIIGDKIEELEADKKAIQDLSDKQVRDKAVDAVEDRLTELETIFNNEYNFDDYARKLYIIQNCIYGVDIQDVAIQISKLRFFLSLIVDQKNNDIKPLPNLETKFVIANTLIGIDLPKFKVMGEDDHSQDTTKLLKEELKNVREQHFKAVTRKDKQAIKAKDKAIREKIANSLADSMNSYKQEDIDKLQSEIATQSKLLAEAELMPDMVQEIIVRDLFGGESTQKVNYRKERIKECNAQIRLIESKISSLQTNTQAELIRVQAMKIAQWDIYNQNAQADWFDMDWMFGISDGFDIVIGNPPYIDSETMVNMGLADFREFLYNSLKYTRGNWDIYIAFFEVGHNLLNKNGNIIYITPDKWISKTFGTELRKGLLNNFIKIVNSGREVFESANVDSIITHLSKKEIKKIEFYNQTTPNNFEFILEYATSSMEAPFCFDWLFSDNLKFMKKIEQQSSKLSDVSVCESACSTSDAYLIKDLIRNEENPDLESKLKIINTGTIGKYISKWGHKDMTYLKDKYPFPIVDKNKFLKKFPNSYGQKSIKPKIIIKGLTLLDGCLDEFGHFVAGKSTLIVIDNDLNKLKFLMCIINSKLILFYLKEKYSGSSYNTGITFNKGMLNDFPLPKIIEKKHFITIMNSILKLKKQEEDITVLEHQLDVMIYHLYTLNYEEAILVDKNLTVSDFEKYKL